MLVLPVVSQIVVSLHFETDFLRNVDLKCVILPELSAWQGLLQRFHAMLIVLQCEAKQGSVSSSQTERSRPPSADGISPAE